MTRWAEKPIAREIKTLQVTRGGTPLHSASVTLGPASYDFLQLVTIYLGSTGLCPTAASGVVNL
jgi:hypothetical protein